MSGEALPKVEQRLCNGACGQVPETSIADGHTFPLPQQVEAEANIAVDVADHMAAQSLDYARHALGHYGDTGHIGNLVQLAAAHLDCAGAVLSARMRDAAVREGAAKIEAAILDTGSENAGAIDSTGTVIGAVLAEVLQAACKGQTCPRCT